MKKFALLGMVACFLTISLLANPAHAQRWGGLGFRGRDRGVYNSNYYPSADGYAYSPEYYGYSTWSYPYAASNTYYTPYAAANYGWGQPTANAGQSAYSYGYNPSSRINSYVAPVAWDTSNPEYSAKAQDRNTYQSFYSPATNHDAAQIRIRVPDANARVFFDDSPTRQVGMDRVYSSPSLNPNKTYTYIIKATWMDNGKEISRTKDVKVQAGRSTMVDFTSANDSNEAIPGPRDQNRDQNKVVPNNEGQKNDLPNSPTDKNRSENPPSPSDKSQP